MSDTAKPPSEYDPGDSWLENGLECCARCEKQFGGEGGTHGPVVTDTGQQYDSLYDTEPGTAPLFCPLCWQRVDAARKAQENESLTDYGAGP